MSFYSIEPSLKKFILYLITPNQMLLFYFDNDGLIKIYPLSTKLNIKRQLVVIFVTDCGMFPTVKVGCFSTFLQQRYRF